MDRPIEIHCHDVECSKGLHDYITAQAQGLEGIHSHLTGCRVHIEQPHRHRQTHKGWKVMVAVSIPRHADVVVKKSSDHHDSHDNLLKLLAEAFESVETSLHSLAEIERGRVKAHPHQDIQGTVQKLFPDHGFLGTPDGREFYFHRNSVLHGRFEDLALGCGVAFTEEEGDQGPQASTVHVVTSLPIS